MSLTGDKYTQESITSVRVWVPEKLFSFTCTRPASFRFIAGQFARLGVNNQQKILGESNIIWRAYSMVSSPYDESLEFFSIVVPNGAFTSHLSHLKTGDPLYLDNTNFGFLTTARFESGKHLWLLASGTGLAPFLSILHDPSTWTQFERIFLVHSARTAQELVYQEQIQSLPTHPLLSELIDNLDQRFVYIPVVTRGKMPNGLEQRIPALLENHTLEQHTGFAITQAESRFMICGNPDMVSDTRQILKKLGFSPARRSTPGEIAVENYW